MSRAAALSRSLAFFAVAVAFIGIVMARAGLDPTAAMAVEAAASLVAGLAILSALIAAVAIWRTGYRGVGHALAGVGLAALVLAYPGYVLLSVSHTPILYDASTDLTDPPSFSTAAQAVAARGGTTPGAPSAVEKALQQRLYPDLQPLILDSEAIDAHGVLMKLVAARHWRVVNDELPLGRLGVGRIDAIAKTTIMGFPIDVTIRIKPVGGQSSVDIRSVSRTRWQEPGGNAARIQALAADLDDQLSDDK